MALQINECPINHSFLSNWFSFFQSLLKPCKFTHFPDQEVNADNRCSRICYGSGIHYAVDSQEDREDDKKRKQENNLSGKGHEYTQYGFPNGGEEIGSNRLYAIYKSQKQKDPEIPFRKFKIGLASVSKDGNNLPWEKLKAEECQNRNKRCT